MVRRKVLGTICWVCDLFSCINLSLIRFGSFDLPMKMQFYGAPKSSAIDQRGQSGPLPSTGFLRKYLRDDYIKNVMTEREVLEAS